MYLYSVCILILILLTMNAMKAKVRQKFIALVSCINVFMFSIYVSIPNFCGNCLQKEIICL